MYTHKRNAHTHIETQVYDVYNLYSVENFYNFDTFYDADAFYNVYNVSGVCNAREGTEMTPRGSGATRRMVFLEFEFLGRDQNYGLVKLYSYMYFPVSDFWIPALRVEGQAATGDPPFYALPFIYMRGVPALRYQGDYTALIETENLFNVTSRWSLVAFAGTGIAFESLEDPNAESQVAWSAGGGFRYLIARLLGSRAGIDIARGPEQWAFYVVFGKSWR